MRTKAAPCFALALTLSTCLLPRLARAGEPAVEAPKEVAQPAPVRTWLPNDPAGAITLGTLFSEHLTGAYLDSITGLWAPRNRDAFLFLDSRYHLEDDGQFISSTGLGFRKQLPGREVIVGGNVFWDALHSERDNDFNQLGLGLELLTHRFDARFNYYLPEDERYEIGRGSSTQTTQFVTGGNLVSQSHTRHFKSYEAALKGFNAEAGVLLPGLDRYMEVRVFGGFYHYDNPFGHDFDGFKARLEARLLPGVIADLEYWDDAALMGGHWTAGVRVSVPFSILNLVNGRNPFEGIGESFTPGRQRVFAERMDDMVIRSHRIQSTSSGNLPSGDSTTTRVTALSLPPQPRPQPVPPPPVPFE